MQRSTTLTAFLFVCLYSSAGFARYDFPELTGEYAVGSTLCYWVDEQRRELHDKEQESPRELMVEIFYPALLGVDTSEHEKLRYDPVAIAFLKNELECEQLSAKHLKGLDDVFTHAVADALPATEYGPFPIIFFSHGLWAPRANNTAYAQELASHGYVVVCIGHTYACGLTLFPDGRSVAFDDELGELFEQQDQEQNTWVADHDFVLKKLIELSARDLVNQFVGLLDFDRVGIVGHSFGGSVAAQLCRTDQRFSAGVNLDGPLFGSDASKPSKVPFMTMRGDVFLKRFEQEDSDEFDGMWEEKEQLQKRYIDAIDQFCQQAEVDNYLLTIHGADHLSFTDAPILKRSCFMLGYLDFLTGTIEELRMNKLVNDYLVNFFDQYLKNKKSELLNQKKSPHRGVFVKRFAVSEDVKN
ncbi:MAG: alpha/beta fold hydrolase [Epsilonproteobacteria bacterium]|nr:alpha/beta fold hydrolase [Campylobacterota bacterium]